MRDAQGSFKLSWVSDAGEPGKHYGPGCASVRVATAMLLWCLSQFVSSSPGYPSTAVDNVEHIRTLESLQFFGIIQSFIFIPPPPQYIPPLH